MVSQFATVVLLIAVVYIQAGLSIENLDYGVEQAEKVAKGICWHQYIKKPSQGRKSFTAYWECIKKLDFSKKFLSLREKDGLTDNELYLKLSKIIIKGIGKSLPTYIKCATNYSTTNPEALDPEGRMILRVVGFRFSIGPTRKNSKPRGHRNQKKVVAPPKPKTDFAWVLKDTERGDYPFKSFSHCLLELALKQRKGAVLNHLIDHWAKLEEAKQKKAAEAKPDENPTQIDEETVKEVIQEEEIVVEENEEEVKEEEKPEEVIEPEVKEEEVEEPAAEVEEEKAKFSIEDFEYGLAQAQRVAAAVCWIEKLNKPYPENDGGDGYINCKKNHDYVKIFKSCLGGIEGEVDDAEEACWETPMKAAVENNLPTYSSCLSILQEDELPPSKDYSALVGDSDRAEYPYKGYTHCLLEELEDDNGQQGLDDLKSKWENPKSFLDTMLEKENEHRSRHSSPPLEIDEELTARAQSYVDHLAAEVCEPVHMPFKDPAKKYNGTKCGENVAEISELSLSDDEIAAVVSVVWYKESELYPWPLFNGFMDVWMQNMVGHFTQSVWKDSTHVGYALSKETESCRKKFVVARYWPVGNTFWKDGQEERTKNAFEKNVLPSNN